MWLFTKSKIRRSVKSPVCEAVATFEDRTLLSGVAIYPQPAEVATADAGTAASPADFSGGWAYNSPEGFGEADITQNGNKIDVSLFFSGEINVHINVDGKVKGDIAKFKVNKVIEGYNVKAKITATLDEPSEMSGIAKGKIAGLGKFTVPFTVWRIPFHD